MMGRLLVIAIAMLLVGAEPVAADPVSALLGKVIAWLGGEAIKKFLIQMAVGLALGALANAMRKPPKRPRTEVAVYGDLAPEEIIFGRYATRGAYGHPVYTTGDYAHLVVTLCALPGAQLRRVAIQGEWVDLDTANPHPDYGWPAAAGSKYAGALWVKYYDGSQVTADPYMLSTFGSDPIAPWSSDMIGEGLCYAIVTCLKGQNPPIWAGLPQPLFEMDGVPLYDPRQDDTAGGTGPQRWADSSTWQPTTNPAVIAYNVLRGIALPGGDVWGGRATADDLPYAVWAAAMDVCDEQVPDGAGGTKPRYTAGLAVSMDREPAEAIEQLVEAMAGEIVALPDGRWLVSAGGPGLPVGAIEDERDTLRGRVSTVHPQVRAAERWIGVAPTWVSPADLWQAHAGDAVMSTTLPDVGGRRVADVRLEAVWDGEQAGRIATSWLADHELQRRHVISLPPSHGWMEPLDVVTVTSERFGYAAKAFEVVTVSEVAHSGLVTATLKEIDHGGWA